MQYKPSHSDGYKKAVRSVLLHDSDGNVRELRGATSRNPLRTIASTLEVADVIALTMVLVAALSTYATWKTAQATKELILTSQRPYIGPAPVNVIRTRH